MNIDHCRVSPVRQGSQHRGIYMLTAATPARGGALARCITTIKHYRLPANPAGRALHARSGSQSSAREPQRIPQGERSMHEVAVNSSARDSQRIPQGERSAHEVALNSSHTSPSESRRESAPRTKRHSIALHVTLSESRRESAPRTK
ncbi:hypothetical protein D3C87_517280 [compost metagenome]